MRKLAQCAGSTTHIFDFDGTLLDTEQHSINAALAALTRFGAFPSREWCAAKPMVSAARCRERLSHDYGVRLDCPHDGRRRGCSREVGCAIGGQPLVSAALITRGRAEEGGHEISREITLDGKHRSSSILFSLLMKSS
ncbi:hypothetical protein OG874_21670 [Nocardia sp. NBC_00565]|uniref:hypothetical protein n=1 Tax=Nocardia sp. NBC_00565 TaxID=2975993 RepID=UPI002E80E94A|nr:hypothetical protein [Nocardia sp. NBC_00565]WUC07534.1 hypothetical protein OG874_21670 [Nocardia sp. NBC_00565]